MPRGITIKVEETGLAANPHIAEQDIEPYSPNYGIRLYHCSC